ncbi:hypothetical protein LOK49_Contig59G00005 [Camellia lanceoleosa]|nr:hypothetical protein LOK49_Contig59G00005 [Camellia lanceoleosa]
MDDFLLCCSRHRHHGKVTLKLSTRALFSHPQNEIFNISKLLSLYPSTFKDLLEYPNRNPSTFKDLEYPYHCCENNGGSLEPNIGRVPQVELLSLQLPFPLVACSLPKKLRDTATRLGVSRMVLHECVLPKILNLTSSGTTEYYLEWVSFCRVLCVVKGDAQSLSTWMKQSSC